MIFVDGTHVDHRCQDAFNRKDVDFGKFFAKLSQGTTLIGVVYCTAPYLFRDHQKHQQGVLNRLRGMPNVTVYLGRHMKREFRCRNCDHLHQDPTEKGTDVAVASHLVQAACSKLAQQVILVAGDNDYWPALEIAKGAKAHCQFAYFVGPDDSLMQKHNEVAMLRKYSTRPAIVLNDAYMADCWFQR
jgi:uncharacterized LabA/DUF88 family protein